MLKGGAVPVRKATDPGNGRMFSLQQHDRDRWLHLSLSPAGCREYFSRHNNTQRQSSHSCFTLLRQCLPVCHLSRLETCDRAFTRLTHDRRELQV